MVLLSMRKEKPFKEYINIDDFDVGIIEMIGQYYVERISDRRIENTLKDINLK